MIPGVVTGAALMAVGIGMMMGVRRIVAQTPKRPAGADFRVADGLLLLAPSEYRGGHVLREHHEHGAQGHPVYLPPARFELGETRVGNRAFLAGNQLFRRANLVALT
jgi:hypothetical protein